MTLFINLTTFFLFTMAKSLHGQILFLLSSRKVNCKQLSIKCRVKCYASRRAIFTIFLFGKPFFDFLKAVRKFIKKGIFFSPERLKVLILFAGTETDFRVQSRSSPLGSRIYQYIIDKASPVQ